MTLTTRKKSFEAMWFSPPVWVSSSAPASCSLPSFLLLLFPKPPILLNLLLLFEVWEDGASLFMIAAEQEENAAPVWLRSMRGST